jgi:hypothetical protein
MAVKIVDFYKWDDDDGYYYFGQRTVNTDHIDHISVNQYDSALYTIKFESGNEVVIGYDDFIALSELMNE